MLNLLPNLASCELCPLHENGFVVAGVGPVPCSIMVVAEAPGEDENTSGKPFTGAAGKELDKYLELAGLDRGEVYITNSVKHWPGKGNPTPSKDMVRKCRGWLDQEIEMVDPDVIICLGKTAIDNIIPGTNLAKAHGKGEWVEVGGRERMIYSMYHPAAPLHQPSLRAILVEDFKNINNNVVSYPDLEVRWIKGLAQEETLSIPDGTEILSLDLETTGLDISTTEIVAVSWCTSKEIGNVVSTPNGIKKVLSLLSHYRGPITIHNGGAFDVPILARYGVHLSTNQIFDTLLTGYILGHELALKTRMLKEHNTLMETFQQVAGKKKIAADADPWRLYPYAAVDAYGHYVLWEGDREEVKANHAEEAFDIEHKLSPILVDMHNAGIRLNEGKALDLYRELSSHIEGLREDVFQCAGDIFDLNNPDTVGRILFDKIGIKPVKKTKSKRQWATDEEVLKTRIADHPIIPMILEYRKWSKMLSTYIVSPLELASHDGRVHTTFKQAGARGGRMSSVNPNLQNQPMRGGWGKKIKDIYEAGDGMVFIESDYGQLELRVAAALSEDPTMLRIFREGGDIHSHNVRAILGREPGNPDDRRLAKNVGFGMLYKLSAAGLQKYLATKSEPPIFASIQEADKLRRAFLDQFPTLMKKEEEWEESAMANGWIENLFHHRRYLPELASGDDKAVEDGLKIAVNLPIQGTAGVITKMAMIELKDYPLRVNVHDSIMLEVGEKWARVVAEDVEMVMSRVAEDVLGVRVEVESGVGKTWGECK